MIIDAHVHLNKRSDVMGRMVKPFVTYTLDGLLAEMEANGVERSYAIGIDNTPTRWNRPRARTPVLPVKTHSDIGVIAGIYPETADKAALERTERAIEKKNVAALKVYLGYLPQFANNKKYYPFYELAQDHSLPVFFHTGYCAPEHLGGADVSPRNSHPDTLRPVIAKFPQLHVVLCHLGNPHTEAAAQLINDSRYVYADLSGFEIGAEPGLGEADRKRLSTHIANVKDRTKLLYGSDWPLVPMAPYIKLVESIVPAKDHERVFSKNAKAFFNR